MLSCPPAERLDEAGRRLFPYQVRGIGGPDGGLPVSRRGPPIAGSRALPPARARRRADCLAAQQGRAADATSLQLGRRGKRAENRRFSQGYVDPTLGSALHYGAWRYAFCAAWASSGWMAPLRTGTPEGEASQHRDAGRAASPRTDVSKHSQGSMERTYHVQTSGFAGVGTFGVAGYHGGGA